MGPTLGSRDPSSKLMFALVCLVSIILSALSTGNSLVSVHLTGLHLCSPKALKFIPSFFFVSSSAWLMIWAVFYLSYLYLSLYFGQFLGFSHKTCIHAICLFFHIPKSLISFMQADSSLAIWAFNFNIDLLLLHIPCLFGDFVFGKLLIYCYPIPACLEQTFLRLHWTPTNWAQLTLYTSVVLSSWIPPFISTHVRKILWPRLEMIEVLDNTSREMIAMFANAMVVIILQYITISNQHVIHLKFMEHYMSIISP